MRVLLLLCAVSGALALTPARIRTPPRTVPNFRDVGGIPCAEGRVVRTGLLLRSATPANATTGDASLIASSVATILDLRDARTAANDAGPRLLAERTSHIGLITENQMRRSLGKLAKQRPLMLARLAALKLARGVSPSRRLKKRAALAIDVQLARLLDDLDLASMYFSILTDRQEELRAALLLAADPEALPLLAHCTHGKDRTGVLIALLLHICGVDEETIKADYSLSEPFGLSEEGMWAMLMALPERVRPYVTRLDLLCEAPEAQMANFFSAVRAEYGSLDAYLDGIGVDATLRADIRRLLTEERA